MPQHLFLPNASWPRPNGSTAQAPAIDLPNLREIWTHWHAIERVSQSDDWALPIERRYAEALGWRSGTATAPIPLAALVTAQTSGAPQAALTPCAWLRPIHVISGMNDIIAQLPASMAMPEAHARAFFDAIKPLCDEDGMTLTWLTPGRWLLTGERLRGITTPSLARASNQHMAPYVPFVSASHLAKHPDAADNLKWLLRLQNEVQMLFYTHPMNDEREGAGLPTISGIWVEGAGALDGATVNGATVEWRDALMDVSDHFDQWQAAWRAIDEGHLADLLNHGALDDRLTLGSQTAQVTWQREATGIRATLGRMRRQWGIQKAPLMPHGLLPNDAP